MRRVIVLINGLPRAGKDTVSNYVCSQARNQGWRSTSISSIDPIREMLRDEGVPVDLKRPEERKLMAEVKSAFDHYDWLATRMCARKVQAWLDAVREAPAICFVHMREAAAIDNFQKLFLDDVEIVKLLVTSPRAEIVTNNVADLDVMNTVYDLTVVNDGTLAELRETCRKLTAELLKEDLNDYDHRQDHSSVA